MTKILKGQMSIDELINKIHNKNWFLKRIGKFVQCTDHPEWETCGGLYVENEIIASNMYFTQYSRSPRYYKD